MKISRNRPICFIPRLVVLILVGMFILAGCNARILKLNVLAVQSLSPGADGQPHPIIVKLYFLKEKANFEGAAYSVLWNTPQEALGSDLVGKPVPIDVAPGDTIMDKQIQKPKDAAFVGVVAGYHHPTEDGWRGVLSLLRRQRKQRVLVHLLSNELQVMYSRHW